MSLSIPQLVAHRGYAHKYPENTLLAVEAAVEAGARFIEFDVLMTADQVPVLFHDRDTQRMCGVPGTIHEQSLAQLQALPVSEPEKFGDAFADISITSLEQVVSYLQTVPEVTAFVELKRQGLDLHGIDLFLDKVLTALSPIKKQVVIISYSLDALLAIKQRSDYQLGAVFDRWDERNSPLIKQLKPHYLFTDIDDLPATGRLVCPENPDCQLAVYECIDPVKAIEVHQQGVALVETFQIKEMLAALNNLKDKP